jgi:hypothetical protein
MAAPKLGNGADDHDHQATSAMSVTSNGIFQGDVPTHFHVPLLILQICVVLAVTRSLSVLLRPLRQPRVIAEIIVSQSSVRAGCSR